MYFLLFLIIYPCPGNKDLIWKKLSFKEVLTIFFIAKKVNKAILILMILLDSDFMKYLFLEKLKLILENFFNVFIFKLSISFSKLIKLIFLLDLYLFGIKFMFFLKLIKPKLSLFELSKYNLFNIKDLYDSKLPI